ncbi:MAG: DUF2922 domain-containing protein [Defluviitaleaceae bacterium]|nr:DUF2922 domain-containing protein [Defluviitaleaceae bacterium]MCL2239751.1 DUF2922 domain-containing protein [Defluviitaleaceae bacterium]
MSAPTTTHSAVLQFRSNTDETIRITIPRARLNKSEPAAREVMEAMIAGGTILTGFGRPAAVRSMEIVTTHRLDIV